MRRSASDSEWDVVEVAAALGFKREATERAMAMCEAAAMPADALVVAMDLARYVLISLDDATEVLILGRGRLRRLGLEVPADVEVLPFVRAEVAGQAKAYASTFFGGLDVREAQGHTFSRVFRDTVERWFGKR